MIIANAFGRRSAIFNKQAQYTRREFECSWAYLPKYNIWNISNIYHKNAWQLKEFVDLFGLHFPAGINYSWLASTLRVAVCNSIRHFISVGRDSRITFHLLLFLSICESHSSSSNGLNEIIQSRFITNSNIFKCFIMQSLVGHSSPPLLGQLPLGALALQFARVTSKNLPQVSCASEVRNLIYIQSLDARVMNHGTDRVY